MRNINKMEQILFFCNQYSVNITSQLLNHKGLIKRSKLMEIDF